MLVLASGSPRRQDALRRLGLPFETRPARVDETPPPGVPPREVAATLARRKLAASPVRDGEWVLAADTLIDLDGSPIGQPRDDADAAAILTRLSGRSHQVHTALALRTPQGAIHEVVETARVTFAALTPQEIQDYVATREPRGKAGAYAIQGRAAAYVTEVDGPIDAVVGLPTVAALRLLKDAGYPLPPALELA